MASLTEEAGSQPLCSTVNGRGGVSPDSLAQGSSTQQAWLQVLKFHPTRSPSSSQIYGLSGKFPPPKSSGVQGSEGPLESPRPGRVAWAAEDPFLGSRASRRQGATCLLVLGHFLKSPHPGLGNPQGI